jgi:Golgi nucleoside diphosphatase
MMAATTPTATADGEFRYGCCIDAGSSGSRIYLYRWPASKHQRQQQPDDENDDDDDDIAVPSSSSDRFIKVERKAIFSQERTPGISHESGLGIQVIQELAALAKAALPIDVNPEYVPIYLGATAGMRLIDSTSSHEGRLPWSHSE